MKKLINSFVLFLLLTLLSFNCYVGSEWWVKREVDRQNTLIELVDAWYFMLSWSFQENYLLPEMQ